VIRLKGWASFLLLVGFSTVLLSALAFQYQLQQDHDAFLETLAAQHRLHSVELEFKHAVQSAFHSTPGADRETRIKAVSLKLVLLESFFENALNDDQMDADVWAGAVSERELRELPQRMISEKQALACSTCRDWFLPTVDSREEPSFYVQGFLDVENNAVRVSRGGASFIPELYGPSFTSDAYALGLSIYFHGHAAVFLAPEGFS